MKRLIRYGFNSIFFTSCLIWMVNLGLADDTCMFMVTADDVAPNIVLLLDNGAEMGQISWHANYDNGTDYTPIVATETDCVPNGAAGNGFFNDNGYGIVSHGSTYYLVPVLNSLALAEYTNGISIGSGWCTFNTKTITLPVQPSTSVDAAGIKDNATNFRYSKNYLNWLFFSGNYAGNGSDLPSKSRFYYSKKAIMTVAKLTSNKASFGIYNFTSNANGASNVQPLGMVVNTPLAALPENNSLDSSFVNNVNNMATVTYSPLAEGLASVAGYYASPSSHVVGEYCQKNFVIVVSPGVSSEDQAVAAGSSPSSFSDYDGDNAAAGIGEGNIKEDATTYTIPINQNGSTNLDDVSHYLNTHDIVDYQAGFQNIYTYTIGFMGDEVSNLFLTNVSNNGNGNLNLYETANPEYGKYHFIAESPDSLSSTLLSAINSILSRTSTFTAPVVPVTRTTSGNRIYMAFFKPGEGNLWEGNVTKFGISNTNEIVDKYDNVATWANGAMKEDAEPYWATKNWSDSTKSNYIHNSNRDIYTYLGSDMYLPDISNSFVSTNARLSSAVLGNPTHATAQIIDYIRGADVFDEDGDTDTAENREIITGDVLHSEPLVVYYNATTTMVYFGANDGMLHAVKDSDGTEAWAFIPPDQLPRLKDIIEGSGHQIFVDSSPKAYIKDTDEDGQIEPGDGDKVILICGQRKGGTSYFVLDVTRPFSPEFKWGINQSTLAMLGESWSVPQFGYVKTSSSDPGTPVFFIGGGYSSTHTVGKAVFAVNALTGAVEKTFDTGMTYSFPSAVTVVDTDGNGIVDKIYVGDLGGQMWRFGKFTDSGGNAFDFPDCDENISHWTGKIIFNATNARKFFYPPTLTLEKGYDALFFGTGNREDACDTGSSDRVYCVKDTHASTTLQESDLVNVTDPAAQVPDLSGDVDQGWFIELASGEKVLAEGTVFYKTFYFTTFTPNNDPCLPGGAARIYALQYLTGAAVLDFTGDNNAERSTEIGGGIPSKPVTVITEGGQKMFISVGSTNPDAQSEEIGAGIRAIDPLAPPNNFFKLWWEELF